ncbi:MAG: ATP-binding protein [Planctomycetes bacterium]|nr:ATP-binding protein [Planctomycetota bacterium]
MAQPLRVYFIGAHSTGKTTLARHVRDTFGLPMLTEVARSVLAELEADLDSLRSDIHAVDRYQTEVFHRQVELEGQFRTGFVSDRAFCNLAYAAHHTTVAAKLFRAPQLERYMEWVSDGLIFFVRPHEELIREDGVRKGLSFREIVTIDGMVKMLLEMYGMSYFPIESLGMQERVRTVDAAIRMRLRIQDLEEAQSGQERIRLDAAPRSANGSGKKAEPNGHRDPVAT